MTAKCKVGLVLEGGGMRGAFTAGVLDYFLDKNLSFHTCIGGVCRSLPRLQLPVKAEAAGI